MTTPPSGRVAAFGAALKHIWNDDADRSTHAPADAVRSPSFGRRAGSVTKES